MKCDRDPNGCGACQRFEIACSNIYGDGEAVELPNQVEAAGPLTQGGLKRRRTRAACNQCHQLKAKCSGDTPCTRCRAQGQKCSYRPAELALTSPRQSRNNANALPSGPEARPGVTTLGNKDNTRRYIEAYFEQNDSAGRMFLHRASTIADFHEDRLDPMLVQALAAFGSRQSACASESRKADDAMNQVEMDLLSSLEEIALSRLQALVLLLHYRRMSAKRNQLWMLLSLASRMAFTLCLNHEHEELSPVRQESNRRLMWSIYMLDTLGCAGLDSLAICPLSHLQIRLPCDERTYSFGVPSMTTRIHRPPPTTSTHAEGVLASILRLMPIRHQVLRQVKGC